ncbi:MAG TPA: 3-hydroxyacyl-CoA dehydrogenase, partial [Alteromonas macleodii]|nr:3-hydroxyacyl-CoA dehydrogenase [Alteromonas macleodii]
MTLNNLTAIVTGGCSGLGHATAIALRDAGANVSLFDLNEELGAQRVEELGNNNTLFTKVDVRDEASVQAAIDATTERFGAISLVV